MGIMSWFRNKLFLNKFAGYSFINYLIVIFALVSIAVG